MALASAQNQILPADFLKEEVRCGYTVSAEMKKIWAVQLDLLARFDAACTANGLCYFLFFGSLLGAVRHGGYIPWDDDVDVAMFRPDFEKLKEKAPEIFSAPYFFQTAENSPRLIWNCRARLRRSDTTGVQHGAELGIPGNQGISIDIFILDRVEQDAAARQKRWNRIDRYLALQYVKIRGETVQRLPAIQKGRWATRLVKARALFYSVGALQKKIEAAFCADLRQADCYTVHSDAMGRYRHVLFTPEELAGERRVPFEHLSLPVMRDPVPVLRRLFGEDYMTFPPASQRRPKHSGIVSADLPYDLYLKRFEDIFRHVDGRKIVVFGGGEMFEHYFRHRGKRYRPSFIVDNDRRKWGKHLHGIEIRPPAALCAVPAEELYLILCSVHYKEIERQIADMGIRTYYIYVQNKKWL